VATADVHLGCEKAGGRMWIRVPIRRPLSDGPHKRCRDMAEPSGKLRDNVSITSTLQIIELTMLKAPKVESNNCRWCLAK